MGEAQFGVNIWADQIHKVRELEDLGYDSLWTGEHMLFHGPILDGLTPLAAAASLTRRVKLGTAILLLSLRNPVVTAKEVSSLDVISGGRVILGVGVGGEYPPEFEAVGVPLAERGRRVGEGIRVLKTLWQEGASDFSGRWTNFTQADMRPKPVQPGGPPIWVSGRSEASAKRGARLADGYMPYLIHEQRYQETQDRIREWGREAGRDIDQEGFTWAHYVFVNADSNHEAAHAAAVAELSKRYNQDFGPFVDRYCAVGTPDEVAARLRSFMDIGVQHFVMSPVCSREAQDDLWRQVAQEVLPKLRG